MKSWHDNLNHCILDSTFSEQDSPVEGETERGLTEASFLNFVREQSVTDPVSVMLGLAASGIDFQFNSCSGDQEEFQDPCWTFEKDSALVQVSML